MATNFLQATGGSTAGYFSPVVTVISSELVSLASSFVVSGATVFTSSANIGQAIWGEMWVKWGGAGITPAIGAYISGWWLRSPDGGTTFETATSSAVSLGRAPDFVIPLSTLAYAATNISYSAGIVKMPWSPFKAFIQNSAGVSFPSSVTGGYTVIQVGPVAVQY